MGSLYSTIEQLCINNGITITQMCKESGASRASLTDLKMGRKQSLSTSTLLKIANYFGTSIENLLGCDDGTTQKQEGDFVFYDTLKEMCGHTGGQEKSPTTETNSGTVVLDEHTNKDIVMIARAGKKMTSDQAERLRRLAQYIFPEAFTDDN